MSTSQRNYYVCTLTEAFHADKEIYMGKNDLISVIVNNKYYKHGKAMLSHSEIVHVHDERQM